MYLDRYINKFISVLLVKKDFESAVIWLVTKVLKHFYRFKLDIKKTLLPVFYAAFRQGFSIGKAVKYLRDQKGFVTHSAKTILDKLKLFDIDELTRVFDSCRVVIFLALKKLDFRKSKKIVAVDYHKKPFYGKGVREVVGCERKAGTNQAYNYITACIIEEGVRFNLGCLAVTQLDVEEDLLREIIKFCKKYVCIGCLLMDRGFNSVTNYKLLHEELGLYYIMPQEKNTKIKKMLEEKNLTVLSITKYTFYENKAEEYQYTINLITLTGEEGKNYTFVTNINTSSEKVMGIIIESYRKRWGIETGYRTSKNFFCKTTSKSFTLRTLFTQLSFILQDFWTLQNYLIHRKKGTQQPRWQLLKNYKKITGFLKALTTPLLFDWKPIIEASMFCENFTDHIKNKLNKKHTPTT